MSLKQVLNVMAYPGMVKKTLTTSTHSRVYLLHGDFVLKNFVSESREKTDPTSLEIYDIQAKVGDHPFIEKPFFAYKGDEGEVLITGFRQVTIEFTLTAAILEKILSALLYMDMKGVKHEDLGGYNIGLDKQGDPFIYDFDKAYYFDWHTLSIDSRLLSGFFLEHSNYVKIDPFNIDLLLNFYFADQLIQREENGKKSEAIELYSCFLKYSIQYFIQLQNLLCQQGLSSRYIQAIDQRISSIEAVLGVPELIIATYEDKIYKTLFAARKWAEVNVEQKGRSELRSYLELTQRRLFMWDAYKTLRQSIPEKNENL
ncbi:hypothetical protein A2526_00175 [candidate division WOR-1 bacterium RIFOXYD2_FULL_36_8]|uniref:Protein kinase domain-containing protein n=1 Tax=candidate division WOR-1 bacterium RIFOXYB2_FULL_36_35 TaxID=1802578 RepID=A0A1F4RXT3_UNCSA|nr:MAG: hypothetical protein A2230_03345 [candidate division WOR-1 bacterium RIFOXYA2_FULL_36_21]OGC12981.1 MAG: hypothetical protein A2290_04945 [candidate division WOR-1 bacterium RIFOXYB2_FULL_36_35]OGC15195.1 MAG: hypothetical protein A2282_07545 [candidate division WOR-1 bacterium RIFOXYA12_FULL_36_13]OGC40057.1 MAG: hypothetical protein A2526_00175 [candidate division WOR-1 bacterium RIFOXYD2_FULL_36_8]